MWYQHSINKYLYYNHLSKSLMMILFLALTGTIREFIPSEIKKVILNNLLVKHLMIFLYIYIVILSISGVDYVEDRFMISLILYVWFIMLSKCSSLYFISVISITILSYLIVYIFRNIEIKYKYRYNKETKNHIYYQKLRYYEFYTGISMILLCILITLIGFSQFIKKQIDLGKSTNKIIKAVFSPNA